MQERREALSLMYKVIGIEVADGMVFFGLNSFADITIFNQEVGLQLSKKPAGSKKEFANFTSRELLSFLKQTELHVDYDVVCFVSLVKTVVWNEKFKSRLSPTEFEKVEKDCAHQLRQK